MSADEVGYFFSALFGELVSPTVLLPRPSRLSHGLFLSKESIFLLSTDRRITCRKLSSFLYNFKRYTILIKTECNRITVTSICRLITLISRVAFLLADPAVVAESRDSSELLIFLPHYSIPTLTHQFPSSPKLLLLRPSCRPQLPLSRLHRSNRVLAQLSLLISLLLLQTQLLILPLPLHLQPHQPSLALADGVE